MSCNKDIVLTLNQLKNLSEQISKLIQDENYIEVNRVLNLKDKVVETLVNLHKNNSEEYSKEIIDLFNLVKKIDEQNISVINSLYSDIKKEKTVIDANNLVQTAYGNKNVAVGNVLDVSE